MAGLYDLTPRVAVYAPFAPDPLLGQLLIDTIRDACMDCLCWAYEMEPFTLAAGEYLLDLYDLPPDSVVIAPQQLIINTVSVTPTTPAHLAATVTDWSEQIGSPKHYMLLSDNSLRIWPIPSGSMPVYLRLFLKPGLQARGVDDMLVSRHFDTLLLGTLARLFALPKRQWTDTPAALRYQQLYDIAKRQLRSQAVDGFIRGVPRAVRYGGY